MIMREDKPLWMVEMELDCQPEHDSRRARQAALGELLAYLAALAAIVAAALIWF